jgi:hypothetical protein
MHPDVAGACSAEQVVATHNTALAVGKSGKVNTILEMDWPSSDDDDDFGEPVVDSDAEGVGEDREDDGEPSKKCRRVRMPLS